MFSLAGKWAVITGGGTGIGAGIALQMVRAGAGVVLAGRRIAKLEETAAALRREAPDAAVRCFECDVRSRQSCEDLITQSFEVGPVHALINNAGIEGDITDVQSCADDVWDDLFATNVRSNFYLARAITPRFRERYEAEKAKDSWDTPLHTGAIIVMASIAGKAGMGNLAPYAATNFARIGFAKSLALELAPIRVTVNALCPGVVWTPMWSRIGASMDASAQSDQTFRRKVEEWIPMGRPQTTEDMGKLAVYIATQPNVTAQDIYIDGGYTHF